jgi:hypothetical protein
MENPLPRHSGKYPQYQSQALYSFQEDILCCEPPFAFKTRESILAIIHGIARKGHLLEDNTGSAVMFIASS